MVEEPTPVAKRLWPRRALLTSAATLGAAAGGGAIAWRLGLLDMTGPAPTTSPVPSGPDATASDPTLRVETPRGTVIVQAVAPGVVRVQIQRGSGSVPVRHSYAVEKPPAALPAAVSTTPTAHTLTTPEISVSVDPATGALSAKDGRGNRFIEEAPKGYRERGFGYRWQLLLDHDESCHGLGQRAFSLSLRDREYRLWNVDARSYPPGKDPLYLSVPFYLGHRPTHSYGIFWDNPGRGTLDLDSDNNGLLTYRTESGSPDIYLIAGPAPQQVVERFTSLTGRMELPPLWALGYQQSRWGYRTEADFRRVADQLRSRRIPCDALHFDIDYMDGYRIFTWNTAAFPNPGRLLGDLRKDGFRAVAILDPGIKEDPAYRAYSEGRARRVFLTKPSGDPLRREVWAGSSEFPDFTKPATREWWSEQVKNFAKVGFAGLWNDMNEPSTFDTLGTLPDETQHDWEGQTSTHVAGGHAVYGMQMARASREGLAQAHPDARPFNISRAGYAGLQRYATTWNGDSLATWGHLGITIPQLLNVGMSGLPFSGSDAGGFRGDPDAELYLRWMQLASMTPFFRTHSARTARDRAPWTYGNATTDQLRAVIERRYRLLPYLYTQVQQACSTGTPILRPMFFEQPERGELGNIDDQFMLGDDLLVAPILEQGARSRTIVLPPGTWYRFDQGQPVKGGGKITEAAGLDLPLFVRAGAVIPLWPVRQSTSEPLEQLILSVYAGNGESSLYEDAGDGYGYREGEQRTSTFATKQQGRDLTVTWSHTGAYRPPYQEVETRLYGLTAPPKSVTTDATGRKPTWQGGAHVIESKEFTTLRVRT